jgi:hypothetical protein
MTPAETLEVLILGLSLALVALGACLLVAGYAMFALGGCSLPQPLATRFIRWGAWCGGIGFGLFGVWAMHP